MVSETHLTNVGRRYGGLVFGLNKGNQIPWYKILQLEQLQRELSMILLFFKDNWQQLPLPVVYMYA